MLAAWSLVPRGDDRADWRVAYQTHQLLATMHAMIGNKQDPPATSDLLLDFATGEEGDEDDAEPEASPEDIDYSAAILSSWTKSARSKMSKSKMKH